MNRGRKQLHTKIKCPFEIPENPLNSNSVRFQRLRHKLSDFVDRISNLWSGNGSILQRANKCHERNLNHVWIAYSWTS